MSQFQLDQLTNFSPEEVAIAGKMLRPHTNTPDESFDSEQFIAFLKTLNRVRGEDRCVITAKGLTKEGLLKQGAAVSDDPAVPLSLAV